MINAKTRKAILKAFFIFAVLAAVIYLFRVSGLNEVLDKHWMDVHIRDQGLSGYVLFLAIAAGFTAAGFPRQMISFFAGYVFGAVTGTVMGTVGTALGCAVAFYYARYAGRAAIERKLGKKTAKLNAFLQREPFQMTVVIRLLPVGSNILTNLLAGITSISSLSFLGGSTLGYIPQTFIFALLGSGVNVDPVWRTTVSALLMIISSLLGYRLYRKYRVESELES
ncbi:VTT domain-containing protein [Desulfovibrio mangrovi]|uniref:TVP38/TMEM64 family protein n=1 Tax=Desulfovibrio mangrovi TaxID=2976983 RepID=UPI0022458B86|nr:VTT domain-containing protein [Desulfovibrio mangrovi]UZP68359.1 VTT domain-containing protein [Desulfovibrio mangrovi]